MVVDRQGSSASSAENISNKLPGSMPSPGAKADVELGTLPSTTADQASPQPAPQPLDDATAGPPTDGAALQEDDERFSSVSYFDILKHFSLMGYIGMYNPCIAPHLPGRHLRLRALTDPRLPHLCAAGFGGPAAHIGAFFFAPALRLS